MNARESMRRHYRIKAYALFYGTLAAIGFVLGALACCQ